MPKSDYQHALEYIYSHIDFSVKRSYRYSPEVFELQRVRDLLHALGDPQDDYATLHVAGTKGKGSTCALLASTLQASGYRTGLYTSPHLLRFNERIRVGGEDIADEELVGLVDEARPQIDAIPGLTVFEIVTALAFLHFHNVGVEAAVIEVGLGGRLDATNVIHPKVAVITSLSYDHMHLLGPSLSDIAREKAGIIKPGIPIVLAPQQYEAERVVEAVAKERGAPLIRVGDDWLFSPGRRTLEGQTLYIWSRREQELMDAFVESAGGEEWAPPKYFIPLLGHHQVINATVAYAALQAARDAGLDLSESAIQEGFRHVRWRGRFQIVGHDPTIVLDAAHNRDSALKLRIALDDYFPGQPVTLIFGASADKDIAGMLMELSPRVSRVIVTKAKHPRAERPEALQKIAHTYGMRVMAVVPIEKAINQAIAAARPGEVILIAGSIFVAGEAMEVLVRNGIELTHETSKQ